LINAIGIQLLQVNKKELNIYLNSMILILQVCFLTNKIAEAFGGTFAKPHKPTLMKSFAKEPPSKRTKTDTK
jgi:hypothetical protein